MGSFKNLPVSLIALVLLQTLALANPAPLPQITPAPLVGYHPTHSCYTATATGECFCPLFNPATCGPIPECILLETTTIPCKDPRCPVTKTTTVCDCPHCQKGCATDVETVTCTRTEA